MELLGGHSLREKRSLKNGRKRTGVNIAQIKKSSKGINNMVYNFTT
ncbi:unnamed protein product [Thelazia callipaeda]|uniref:Transcriptional regulator n=1 Tax=Thelazia callipaeda TaxID=103827 RepID=A0A0N5D858_THECL|nr:unnamed protein product [Thelazia callipaeda]